MDDTRRGEGRPDAGRPYASRPPQARPHDPRSRQHARPYEPRARDARPYDAHGDDARHEPRHDARHEEPGDEAAHAARTHRQTELRLYGLNAVNAVFSRRPEAIRKLYLLESRIPAVQPMLKWCVAHRVGYRVAEEADLDRLAASTHHEGLVADVLREEPQTLSPWLRDLPAGPQCALWLDGVGNPHNFGAILRSAAHFGVSAVLLPKHSPLALSGAAARVAEGGAEIVPLVRLGRSDNAIAQLRSAGFTLAATLVHGGRDVFTADLPERVVYVIGAEGEGMDRDLAQACDMRISIPGSGAVESLNVAAATAVLLARWRHR
ncbi:TrmH family RNA methyltransferase [Agrilutibacter solisilvae]|uniref:TrmH family RNA methyltransferase n=1 Tax=Agrilutibacter solisilvae TaxID=2763317 RepID=UPI001FD67DBC|nr:TrmH family RNA methyltransferase [Lysobacter solisilvae]